MDYNNRLRELYDSRLENLKKMFRELNESLNDADTNFSWPLLLRIWEKEYYDAPIKLMVFGQETKGWNNPVNSKIEENTAESLTEEYYLHNLGRHRLGRSSFFRTIHDLNRRVGNPDSNCFVWNNILKFGKEDSAGYPSDNVMEAELKYLNVIPDEIEILNPDACVFLTGPNYDSDIKKRFQDAVFIPVEGFKSRELIIIKSKSLPQKTFRTYHPGYGSIYREGYDRIIDTIIRMIK
ncbi:MAG: hypothetical protein K2H96_07735 [Muribaculaceae bacterium]|nr:hypothetical protein [Muribaculaceae bacterium]